ncbi:MULTISPECIES: ROK family protein [unclassified Sphingomonas]|uniref:ROK family protein n=1 Tax=unclassified Sphingomonas TaxID=196159 RepID=UPI0021515CB4|nr:MULTISPECIES: ROK family protein [unclassified Sphingomonas]MCR5872521.1 ROK family protein [Sphingomonas sp. J344]UUX99193.1 ROK family protein [Sphingomonas sp. J315]
MSDAPRYAGIELGGTKAIAVLTQGDAIVERHSVATGEPIATLGALRAILDGWAAAAPLAGLGIASFGPIQLDPRDPRLGQILATPKPGWTGAPVAALLSEGLACPMVIDTDVNGAALAEYRWGAAVGCDSLCYLTIGTGLGGGLLIGGKPVHGAMHPEIGHIRLRRVAGDLFPGACDFHGDCVEGLVSGPALAARFGMDPATASDGDPIWRHVAADIAELCCAILLTTSARRILFGGSVALSRAFILPWVREIVVAQLESYLPFVTTEAVGEIIQPAGLGTDAGPLGAIALAQAASR